MASHSEKRLTMHFSPRTHPHRLHPHPHERSSHQIRPPKRYEITNIQLQNQKIAEEGRRHGRPETQVASSVYVAKRALLTQRNPFRYLCGRNSQARPSISSILQGRKGRNNYSVMPSMDPVHRWPGGNGQHLAQREFLCRLEYRFGYECPGNSTRAYKRAGLPCSRKDHRRRLDSQLPENTNPPTVARSILFVLSGPRSP